MLIQAESIENAYDKAMKIGRKNYSMRYKAASGKVCGWKVLGLSSLVQVYKDIEDGAEIAFTDNALIAAKTSERMVKTKKIVVRGITVLTMAMKRVDLLFAVFVCALRYVSTNLTPLALCAIKHYDWQELYK